MNRFKTMLLLATLTALFLWIGQLFAGRTGLVYAIFFAGIMNFVAYWFSDKIVLKMYGAQEATQDQAPQLFSIVQNLSMKIGIPMPKVYVIPEQAPNAFATGRNPENAAVAATVGLIQMLSEDELEGVLAHELAHVVNRDTLISTIAATLAGALGHLANMAMWSGMLGGRSNNEDRHPAAGLVGMIVAPIAATLIQMAISRSREFLADETGAQICGKPLSLASALKKIEGWKQRIPMAHGSPATAHMFIINPFSGGGLASMFSTHPSTEERIKRLENMAYSGPSLRYD